jgi:TetR/AcrR family transcriptional regulator
MSTAERRARERAQRQQEILDAAREVFFSLGIGRATVDDVAACAEVSKGTIYLYYQSKEELLAHLLLEGLDQLVAELEAVCQKEGHPSSEACLRDLARAYTDFSQQEPHYFRLLMAFDRGRFQEQTPAELHQQVLEGSLRGLEIVAGVIRRGIESGEFAADDAWRTAGALWAALNGVLVLMAHPIRRRMLEADLSVMIDTTLDLVLRGLRA